MALITCPECNNKISSFSEKCINCGYPVGMICKNQLVENIINDATIEQLNLSLRTYRVLREAGIRSVRDIAAMDISQFMQVKNLGRKSLDEIIDRMFKLGLSIHDDYYNNANLVPKTEATKLDWKCERAPKNISFSSVTYDFSNKELEFLKRGFLPQNMDHKWFCYYENGTVYFYRSWTGKLIYSLILNEETNQHILIRYYEDKEELKDFCKTEIIELIHCLIENW